MPLDDVTPSNGNSSELHPVVTGADSTTQGSPIVDMNRAAIDAHTLKFNHLSNEHNRLCSQYFRTLVETYVLYSGITVVAGHFEHDPHSMLVSILLIVPTLIVYFCTSRSCHMLLEKARSCGRKRDWYLDKIYELSNAPKMPQPFEHPSRSDYASIYHMQRILGTTFMLCLLFYELYISRIWVTLTR